MGATAILMAAMAAQPKKRAVGRPSEPQSRRSRRKAREDGIGVLFPGSARREAGRPAGPVTWTVSADQILLHAVAQGRIELRARKSRARGIGAALRAYMEADLREKQYPRLFPRGYSQRRANEIITERLPRLIKRMSDIKAKNRK